MKRCRTTICCTSSTLNYRIRSCGIRTDTFDLAPTVRNYEKLIDNVSHTSYHNNYYYNFDIAVLQTMQHRGALRATMISYFP